LQYFHLIKSGIKNLEGNKKNLVSQIKKYKNNYQSEHLSRVKS